MLVKNVTPFFHGATVTSRRGRQAEMSLVVRGTFRLVPDGVVAPIEGIDQGFLTGETYAEDDPERQGEPLAPSDFAPWKPCAEVIMRATCHPPGGRPVTQLVAGLSVGAFRKDVAVIGDRIWQGALGGSPSAPRPWKTMPLRWANAFGGPGNARNPAGRGEGQTQLPNVEHPQALIRSRTDAPTPAGFGPINPAWSPRAERVGKDYGKEWMATRAPWPSNDFDWRWSCAAPPDQQLDGYLRGDEEVVLRNLHPAHATLRTRLPGLRVRAFVKDDRGAFREVPLLLDTVFLEPDEDTLKLTWRGLDAVREDDLSDLKTMLIVDEPLAEAPRPVAAYRADLDAYERDPLGLSEKLPAGLVEVGAREDRRARGLPVDEPDLPADLDPVSRELKGRLGPLLSDETFAAVKDAMAKAQKVQPPAGQPPIDLAKAVADARAEERKEPPIPRMIKTGRLPDVRLKARMRTVLAEVERLRGLEKTIGRPIDGIADLEAMPRDPQWKELDPEYEVPGPLSTDAPGPGADLRERDFTEQDLSGIDLRGARLEGANFAHARLRGAQLAGAKMHRTILYCADLEGADLSGADLSMANAAYVRAAGATFTKADLSESFFEGASLAKANLDGVTAPYIVLEGADLTGATARGARFDRSDFSRASLEGAVLTEITAERSLFAHCTAAKSSWAGAQMPQASFADADLGGASMVGANASRALFARTLLGGADLSFALLAGAHFMSAKAGRAKLHGADLREARLDRTDLTAADLSRANLFSADLRKATIEATRFVGASLYDAKLVGVRGGGFDVDGANLTKSVWDRA